MKLLICLLAIAGFAVTASAQEVQVPFDSAGAIEVITPELEQSYRLFPDVTNFREARLFLRSDSTYYLEISYVEDGKIKRIKQEKTPAQIAVLKERLAQPTFDDSTPIVKTKSKLDQSARTKFITTTTLMSTFVYGPLMISSMPDIRSEVAAGLELVIGGAGFLIPLIVTENISVTEGETSLARGGMFLGIAHGGLLSVMFADGDPGREFGFVASLTSIAEMIAGYQIAHVNNFRAGKSDIITTYGLSGLGQGALLPLVAVRDPGDISGTLYSGIVLASSGLGYFAGNALSNAARYTRGDATVTTTAAVFAPLCVLGLLVPSLSSMNAEDAGRILAGSAMAGNITGLWIGHYLAERKDLSEDEGNYIALGTVAGALIGTGVGLILSSGPEDLTDLYQFTIPAVLGTVAGFGISYHVFGKGSGKDEGSNWKVNFDPGALLGSLYDNRPPPVAGPLLRTAPALSLQYHW